ncbi:retrovirus-related pol polyprotein from transposon TNT 1-94 [Tanacetum coccineum]|uniref:Retrovirus-related pol polyprotein from transposon TNT 1-94 n=1 Tax=Tanacetum coccineum TaxID=301880 RepID=A0ABQ4X7M4_9ASTR
MTGNRCFLSEYEDHDGGLVCFGDGKGRISGKGKIKSGTLVFDDVYFCKELKYNLFSVSQICDKKNNVLFTDTECLVLSSDFKLPNENQVLLRFPRKDNIYSVDLKSVVPTKGLTCLFAKATIDESNLWHRRLRHINFKNINKLVRGNLVRGLPSNIFENDHSCVACQKGKQHKASYKAKLVNTISIPLHMLHMDLFGPTNVRNLMRKSYCLVVTDDYSRFSWVFFLATKDETSGILKNFITEIENQLDSKVKVIRSDNGTEFKNSIMNQLCEEKGIKREFSVARTPQQNGVAKRKNRTLIEAARTMLVDSRLPITFWAEAVNTACYVLNRVLVTKPHNKTPYELIRGRPPLIEFMKPFGCHVTILNTRDHLGKFDGKANEGYFVGYYVVSKAIRIFDTDSLTKSMNYVSVVAGNQPNDIAGIRDNFVAGLKVNEQDDGFKPTEVHENEDINGKKPTEVHDNEAFNKGGMNDQDTRSEFERLLQQEKQSNSTNNLNTVSTPVTAVGPSFTANEPSSPVSAVGPFSPFKYVFDLPRAQNVIPIDDSRIFEGAYDDETMGVEADNNNLNTTIQVIPIINALGYSTFCCNPDLEVLHIPTTRIHKDHPLELIIGDLHSALLTRRQSQQNLLEHALVFSNKKDERGIVVMNKARLVAQGHTQDEGIDYDEVFAPVARIKAIRLFLAYASFKDFVVYQMDVKSAFLYEKIEEEVYVCQPPGFEDPNFPDKVYKVEKALYGLHQAPRAWYETLSSYLLDNGYHRGQIDKSLFIKRHEDDILLIQIYVDDIIFGSTKKEMSVEFEKTMHRRFQMSYMGELTFFLGLQVKQKDNGIFIRQDKYVAEILMKFDFATIKTASTPIEPNKTLLKDEEADDVDVHLYRLMIGLLMYLTASIPDIMFAVCACASDYGGASIDRKSTTGGCQFLGKRLNLWQCKKQTIVANSTTEAKYVATANCCGQVLWIQNQMLDYGFDFMHTKINIDNESIITIVKNPKLHGKTKHIEIKHHFIKDCHEKKLIQTIKIHTDQNVGDLLTKGFDVSRFKKHCLRGGIYDGIFLQVLVSNHITNGHQFTMSHRHQELASPKQTTIGKDFSNPLIVDSLLKTIWLSMHHVIAMKHWLFKGKRQMVDSLSNHKEIYAIPSHSKKIFANMRMKGNKFSGRVTPLFPTMLVQAQEVEEEGSADPVDPIESLPSTSQSQPRQESRKSKKKTTKVSHPSGSPNAMEDEPVTHFSSDP